MATNGVLESAVVLPEGEIDSEESVYSRKRLNASSMSLASKRLKLRPSLSREFDTNFESQDGTRRSSVLLANNDTDERKRGRRLFGALLGTLSQNSSSKTQQRRIDIEKMQREKLKIQSEDVDPLKKERYQSLLQVRVQEQARYDEQSLRQRHSNTIALACFLQTNTSPPLYYKPWELLPNEILKIERQIKEAQSQVKNETMTGKVKDSLRMITGNIDDNSTDQNAESDTVGFLADDMRSNFPSLSKRTNAKHGDDQIAEGNTREDCGYEIVEGDAEDPIIY